MKLVDLLVTKLAAALAAKIEPVVASAVERHVAQLVAGHAEVRAAHGRGQDDDEAGGDPISGPLTERSPATRRSNEWAFGATRRAWPSARHEAGGGHE
jgi:hypothetical protein